MKEIIIAGGTGLVGKRLIPILISKGYKINILSRGDNVSQDKHIQYFKWDIQKKIIPEHLFESAAFVINLSGTNVGEKRWNAAYKNEIMESRVQSTRLLVEMMNKASSNVKAFLNVSAIGYYGLETLRPVKEDAIPGKDFMARVCVAWEAEAEKIDQSKTRLVVPRIGIVFSGDGGALVSMATPIKYFVGSALGSGKQMVPWIHIDDLCLSIVFALENENFNGKFNAVSPNPASNIEITRVLAKALHRPLFLPPVPGFVLKIILGEFADSVLGGVNVVPEKLSQNGFTFIHPNLKEAIFQIYAKPQ